MKRFLVLLLLIVVLVIAYAFGASTTRSPGAHLSRNDTRITTAVETAFALNKYLDGTAIKVDVADGGVSLGGTTRTSSQSRLAEEVAATIDGVRGVTNNIAVDPKGPPPAQGAEPRTLSERVEDYTTASRVEEALALHRELDHQDMSVTVFRGTATLTGRVPSWAARELAGKLAEDVEGVRVVDNQLSSPPERRADLLEQHVDAAWEPMRRTDGVAQLELDTNLLMRPQIDLRRLHVKVLDGIAQLTGSVPSEAERSLIEKLAEDCWGVSRVVNDITVAEPTAAAAQPGDHLASSLPPGS